MKISYTVIVACVLGAACAQTSPPQTPVTLQITSSEPTIKTGSAAKLQVTLINHSQSPLSVLTTPGQVNAELWYDVQLRDANGTEVPKTKYKKILEGTEKGHVASSAISQTIPRGGSLKEEISLANLYDLSRPGKYFVHVERVLPASFGTTRIKSNVIDITVSR